MHLGKKKKLNHDNEAERKTMREKDRQNKKEFGTNRDKTQNEEEKERHQPWKREDSLKNCQNRQTERERASRDGYVISTKH